MMQLDKRMEILMQLYNRRLYKKYTFNCEIRMSLLYYIKNNYNIII